MFFLEILSLLLLNFVIFIIEIRNFRICFILEVGFRVEEVILYCQRVIFFCKLRMQRLADEVKSMFGFILIFVAFEVDRGVNYLISIQFENFVFDK